MAPTAAARALSAVCARGARALWPRHLPPQPALGRARCLGLPASLTPSVHVLDYCLPVTSFSFFFPAPLPRILFPKADARRSKWEKGLSLSRTLPLPGGGGGGCCLLRLLPALRSSPGCERREARGAGGDPDFSAHAQVPRCHAALSPRWRLPGRRALGGRWDQAAGRVGSLASGASPAQLSHTRPHLCPRCFRGRLVGQLGFFLWGSSKLICLCCFEVLEIQSWSQRNDERTPAQLQCIARLKTFP